MLVGAVIEEVAVAGAGDFSSPALDVECGTEVGKPQTRAVGTVISAMGARGRCACADQDGPALRIGAIEGVAPARREARRAHAVKGVVQILSAVASSLDHQDALRAGIQDGGKIVGPPFDGDVALLVATGLEVESRPCAVDFQQDDVARREPVRGLAYRSGRAVADEGDGRQARVGRDAQDASDVVVAADLAHHGRAVVPVAVIASVEQATCIHEQIFMAEIPAPLEIDQALPVAATPRLGPGEAGIDATGRDFQIALARIEVGRGGGRGVGVARWKDGPVLIQEHRRLAAGLQVGGLNGGLVEQVFDQLFGVLGGVVDEVEAPGVGRGAGRAHHGLAHAGARAGLGVAEQRLQRNLGRLEQAGQAVGLCCRRAAQRASRRMKVCLGLGDDDEFGGGLDWAHGAFSSH